MASVLSQILDRVNAIVTAQMPAGTLVLRDAADPVADASWVNQVVHDAAVERFSDDMDRHQAVVELKFGVRSDSAPSVACEALHFAVHAAIVDDATLKDLAQSRRLVDTSIDYQQADQTAVIKTCRYVFTYLIPANTI